MNPGNGWPKSRAFDRTVDRARARVSTQEPPTMPMDVVAEAAAMALRFLDENPGAGVLIAEDVAQCLGLPCPVDALPPDPEVGPDAQGPLEGVLPVLGGFVADDESGGASWDDGISGRRDPVV